MKTVTRIFSSRTPHFITRINGTEILVLGTAHVSRQSVEDVEQAFARYRPDTVCVELCSSRFEAMRDPDRWRKLDLSRVIREKKLGLLISNLILASFQKKIGNETGVQPGAEMMRAIELCEEKKKTPVLADREVRTTLRRAWHKIGFFSRMWLASYLFTSLLISEDVEAEEIERLKNEDVLSDLFSRLPRRYQAVKEVIIDERDRYLAEKIRQQVRSDTEAGRKKPRRILAVVGAGHLPGIERTLRLAEKVNTADLELQPPVNRLKNILGWSTLFGLLLGASALIYQVNGWENLLFAWIIGRSAGSGLGALLARAHPLTVLATAALAPLYPLFVFTGTRLWMYAALTELSFHKPRVEDFENIAGDTETFKKFISSLYSNRVLNLFWIIMLVSLGLTIGNLVFFQEFITALIRLISG